MTVLSPAAFKQLFDHYRYSVFRLETEQNYDSPNEVAGLRAFLRGEPPPPDDPGKAEWISVVHAARRTRRTIQRVHVVTEPLSDYIRYELAWSYAPNLQAGEDIRIVAVPKGHAWPVELTCADFWLFDASRLYVMKYDQHNAWRGVRQIHDPSQIIHAAQAREAALHLSVPYTDYVNSRPELRAELRAVS